MLESVLYQLTNIAFALIIFLVFILIIAFLIVFITRKFDIKKKKTMMSGLLLGLTNRQIILLSAITIRTFFIIYSSIMYTPNILFYLIIIFIASLLYIILSLKNVIFEAINMVAQIFFIYFIDIISSYMIEVSNAPYLQVTKIFLILFISAYTLYFFLKNFEEIILKKKEIQNEKK